jgi:ABC-type nitrate/sulfonate/bicarbonate transport system substrate-binding protein
MSHATGHAHDRPGRFSRRGFLGLTAGVGAAGLLTACGASGDNGTIKILNTSATGDTALNHLLTDGKYFERFGVTAQITNVDSGSEILAGVAAGSADITVLSGLIGMLPGIEKGLAVKVVGGTQVVSTSALFTADPRITSVRDLAGKTLGSGAVGSELYAVFAALLAKYHISPSKVTFQDIGSSADSFKAVLARQIDCGYGQVGNQPLAAKHHARMLTTVSRELPLWLNQAAVASTHAIATKRQSLIKVLAAYTALFRYLATPQSRNAYVAAYTASGGSPSGGEAEWRYLNQTTAYSPTLDFPADKADFIQKQNIASGTQTTLLPYDTYTDLSLREEALHLANQ